jgi:hypothetical protein
MVISGEDMAEALRPLGDGGYFSIFSSHPLTSSRIKNVKNVKRSSGTIVPVFGTNLTFVLSLAIVVAITYFSYRLARINILLEAYRGMLLFFRNKYIVLKSILVMLYNRYILR